MKLWIDQIIAGILIIGCLVLIGLGEDGEIKGLLGASAGWILARRTLAR